MVDSPKSVPLQAGETVNRKSRGLGLPAVLWFDLDGQPFTKKPCTGDAYLTNQRLIFEGHELASAWKNVAYNVFWPSSFFLVQGQLTIALPLDKVTEACKTNQIRAQPIKLIHRQNDIPNPIYIDVSDKDAWIIDIQRANRQNPLPSASRQQEPPPPPPNFPSPTCPTCGQQLSYIEQYQRWYCNRDQKYI
jgi:hypothetical protein